MGTELEESDLLKNRVLVPVNPKIRGVIRSTYSVVPGWREATRRERAALFFTEPRFALLDVLLFSVFIAVMTYFGTH